MNNSGPHKLNIIPDKAGADDYLKVSYPIRYGRYSEIRKDKLLLTFNQNGEVKTIQGLDSEWPHPSEWLKRTAGNDWVYYSAGGYNGMFDFIGEYYRPCFTYSTNALLGDNPFDQKIVRSAISRWADDLDAIFTRIGDDCPNEIKTLLDKIITHHPVALDRKAKQFHELIGGRISVLPPDARHVDYDVVPVIIADGCLYNCGFCRVKTGRGFAPRLKGDILRQIAGLKTFYDEDISNYNAIFLGNHDGLYAGETLIHFAAEAAFNAFNFDNSYMKRPRLFMFGSVDSLPAADHSCFKMINDLPFQTFINIGLESFDSETLTLLEKPISTDAVKSAFERMLEVNHRYKNLEITANFVLGNDLSREHITSLIEVLSNIPKKLCSKGTVYISPLYSGGNKGTMVRDFREIKFKSRMPVYLYLIQRL
ncbi:MAG: radical SAM protein [Desulfobacterales bacterium]|nr:radical SAM protein [Desulfobacterales bacterium]